MTDDIWERMPPVLLEYQGRELAGRFFATVAFRHNRRYRLIDNAVLPRFGLPRTLAD
jgi:hypothetical protein